MAFPHPNLRSMGAELNQGATEGSYKTVIKNRGGVVEDTTVRSLEDLSDVYFGIHEELVKQRPDGKSVTTPYFRHTKPVQPSGLVG